MQRKQIEAVARAICDYEDGTDAGQGKCGFRIWAGRPQCAICTNEGAAHMQRKAEVAITAYEKAVNA